MFDVIKKTPITISIALVTVCVFLVPSFSQWLTLDMNVSLWTQLSRIFTCHLLHWSFDHLAWDLLMFVLIGAICERRSAKSYLAVLISSAILIPVSVFYFVPELDSYRGLSGIDTATFVFAAALLIEDTIRRKDWWSTGIYSALLIGLIGKTVSELVGGGTLFVESSNFTPVPVAHIVGAFVGALVVVGRRILSSWTVLKVCFSTFDKQQPTSAKTSC